MRTLSVIAGLLLAVSSVQADSEYSSSIRVLGKCAGFFRGGAQRVSFPGGPSTISCPVAVRIRNGEGDPLPSFRFDITDSARPAVARCRLRESSVRAAAGTTDSRGRSRVRVRLMRRCARHSLSVTAVAPAAVETRVPEICPDLIRSMNQELDRIQSCFKDADCGQVLHGTSCGCTMDKVARKDADSSFFNALHEAAADRCNAGMVSVCTCPPASGFRCISGRCRWAYTEEVHIF